MNIVYFSLKRLNENSITSIKRFSQKERLIDLKSKYITSESKVGYISHYIANALKHLSY